MVGVGLVWIYFWWGCGHIVPLDAIAVVVGTTSGAAAASTAAATC